MKNMAVARRYAKALLLIGKEDGNTETYREELGRLAGLLETQPQLAQAVNNPLYDADGRKNLLHSVVQKLALSEVMTSFVMLLFDKRRFAYINFIDELYQKMADELKGIARATLVSATRLPTETVEKIRATLSSKTGKDIMLEIEQDPELLGGVVTRIGDLVWDGSIKTQLHNMRESLKRGEAV
jgi:F-type H+-transporting ATPase subunit delta